MEKVDALAVIIHAKDIGGGRVLFFHRRFNLPGQAFLDLLVIALKLDHGEKVCIEPFKILRAALLPIVVVVLEPCRIIKDSPVEAKRGGRLVAFREADLGSDVVLGVKAAMNETVEKLPFIELLQRFPFGIADGDVLLGLSINRDHGDGKFLCLSGTCVEVRFSFSKGLAFIPSLMMLFSCFYFGT